MLFSSVNVSQKKLALLEVIFGFIALGALLWLSSSSGWFTTRFDNDSASQAPIIELDNLDGLNNLSKPDKQAPTLTIKQPIARQDDAISETPTTPQTKANQDLHYIVQQGDTLEAIFKKKGLSIDELHQVLEADEPYLVISALKPGNRLDFEVNASNELHKLSLAVNRVETISYSRSNDGFVYAETRKPTIWIKEVIRGTILGSFFASASKAGLSDNSIMTIHQLLKNGLNFRRDLRAGDHFQVVLEQETLNGQPIKNSRLIAVRIISHGKEFGAYLHHDGAYYDADGDSLTLALLRYPTKKRFRISSSFSPRRRHPVTGRYKPHNGVDFAMPIGTPVISTGDGRVTRVANHRYAGKYLAIDEFGPYSTRYLHMSKILVRKGQHVERGQVIGLSGNTGRSTGPHLHYELHINGKPVNPITAKIPTLKSIPAHEIGNFHAQVETIKALMNGKHEIVNHIEQDTEKDQITETKNTSAKQTIL